MHQVVIDEARSAGLRARTVSLEAIDRRRTELWALGVAVITAAVALASLAPDRLPWLAEAASALGLRATLGALAAAFMVYVFEKEVHLRRLQSLLLDERVLRQAVAERATQLADLAEGARAVNDVLDVDEVLARLLDRALGMLEADSGAVLAVDDDSSLTGMLVAACVRGDHRRVGDRVPLTQGYLEDVVRGRRPQLEPRADSAPALLAVPLVHRDEVLGALEVVGDHGREFSDYELQVLALFADYVSVGLANARLYRTERTRVEELTELDELKSQFLANVSHELKTPLTSIIGCVSLLRRPNLPDDERPELYDSIDRQARRLAEMVGQLLIAGRVQEEESHALVETTDLVEVARMVMADAGISGRYVELDPVSPLECAVGVGASTLQQVLWNLVDNAHKYGAPPVRIEIAPRGNVAVLSVIDAGPGIPPDERERVFERFHRVETSNDRPGMGLGLPIVRRLVEARGGRVWIDDVPGGGNAVRVALPTTATTATAATVPSAGTLNGEKPVTP